MRNLILITLSICTLFVVAPAGRSLADEPSRSGPPAVVELQPLPHARMLAPERPMAADVLDALRYWNGKGLALHVTHDSDLQTWATAIADGSPSRERAIWLASIGSLESWHFAPWVLDFTCNRMAGYKACDHGNAVGPFQIWDKSLVGAPPAEHVRAAWALLQRQGPTAWTTQKAARAQADAWLSARE